ncbi:hypothetical protein GGC65_002354 [Sphingopyxis sp. OAS728]|uniref:DUF2840 domain-containing protein n=1 Tax=Sphingopyxis sp. OAS728 TaxID=2663823 RepID=UPI00178B1E4E|nr:DUF2840 domain-containing protein [Sphingopyxis sp. OAS728]MBE1527898.1 hypothetical protein [Sphingopyxis sp. OAS728]
MRRADFEQALRPSLTTRSSAGAYPSPYDAALTEVEMTWIEGRREQWIRFGRVACERNLSRATRVVAFRPGAVFALVRWTSNDFGTIHSTIAIAAAVAPDQPYATLPFVRPGAEILARIDGWSKVQKTLEAIDAVEANGIDGCDAAPDYWRHVGSRIATGLPFRPYSRDRHTAWLRRRAVES